MSTTAIGLTCIAIMLVMIAFRAPIALSMAAMGFIGFGSIVAFDPAISILGTGPFETFQCLADWG